MTDIGIFLTHHSKDRLKERTNYDLAEYKHIATKAFKYGKEASQFIGPIAQFLEDICKKGGTYVAKVWENQIFIFNNMCGHRLLTVYPIPDEYLPIEQYILKKDDMRRCTIKLIDKDTKQIYYWGEFGGLTADIEEAIEFRTQVQAANYLNNNYELDSYKDFYDLLIV